MRDVARFASRLELDTVSTPAAAVPPPPIWMSTPAATVLDLVGAPDLRARRRSLARIRALLFGGITSAGLLVSLVMIWWGVDVVAVLGGLLFAVTSCLPGAATVSCLVWLSRDRGLDGLYLRMTSQYVEYGHEGGRWSAPWAAVRAVRVCCHPAGFGPDVVELRVEAHGWGPFTARGPVGYFDVLARDSDVDLRVVSDLVNHATLGRITLFPDRSEAADRQDAAASTEVWRPLRLFHTAPRPGGENAGPAATAVPSDDPVPAVAHPRWCDRQQCLAVQDDFHPDAPLPMHVGRRYHADPGGRGRRTWVAAQLVQFVGDPQPQRTFVGLIVADLDSEQTFYIDAGQGATLARALLDLAGQADTVAAAGDRPDNAGAGPTPPAGAG
ncbi:hypothetical protein RB614_09045 [Phytohabitans sp. ZYX-F-186]|uniref:DUF3137 domain-containing protein n=1 Tax=Phytohabitans maris TaxID=3071409 RepID=A0ABU0ZC64_9ACTN|nr:hypothetical protein [Phytohabitans sp. ZYX-F-186]MDQ7904665.1 hypothetical protein [Phytohabitans sp. ZYX-F-186]